MVLIGLGNPGKKYVSTRHNAGKMLAAWLKEEGRRKKEEGKWKIMETDCFMNQSGEWVKQWLSSLPSSLYPLPLIIAHDDLDMPLGSFKIHFGRGPRLHKGILSIEQALGTKDFWRVRIGIEGRGKKEEGRRQSGEEFVLRPFKRAEKVILIKTFGLIKRALICHPERSVAESRDLASFSERSRSLRWVSRLPPVARDDDNPV